MGDLFSALGQGDNARKAFQQALNIREKLADEEVESLRGDEEAWQLRRFDPRL